MAIGRPRKDPGEKRGTTLTFKVTSAEHLRLSRLTKHRQEELFQATGQHFDMPVAGYLRWLVDCDAKTRGIPLEEPQDEFGTTEVGLVEPEAVPKVTSAEPAPKPAKPKKAKDLRDEMAAYRTRKGIGQKRLAALIGVPSQSGISSIEAKKRAFAPEQEAAFRALLEAEG